MRNFCDILLNNGLADIPFIILNLSFQSSNEYPKQLPSLECVFGGSSSYTARYEWRQDDHGAWLQSFYTSSNVSSWGETTTNGGESPTLNEDGSLSQSHLYIVNRIDGYITNVVSGYAYSGDPPIQSKRLITDGSGNIHFTLSDIKTDGYLTSGFYTYTDTIIFTDSRYGRPPCEGSATTTGGIFVWTGECDGDDDDDDCGGLLNPDGSCNCCEIGSRVEELFRTWLDGLKT